jgi:hypothetical protein
VIEAGTLEHIFNVPEALRSLMRAAKVGGGLYASMPTNNLCGHGFYQFSPELLFRVLGPDNGYEVETAVIVPARFPSIEIRPALAAYAVRDPEEVRSRVGLMSRKAATLVVFAKRVSAADPLAIAPVQSDYTARWKASERHGSQRSGWRLLARGLIERRRYSLANRDYFTKTH